MSDLWREICQLIGRTRDRTSNNHPQHYGKIERMHRCLKNSLWSRLLGKSNWMAELPWVMLGLRATSNLDTGVSPSILATGQQPTLPGQLVLQRAEIDDASTYGRQLASAMAVQRFTRNSWHGKENVRVKVPQKRVLLRSDKVQPSLEPVRFAFSAAGAKCSICGLRIATILCPSIDSFHASKMTVPTTSHLSRLHPTQLPIRLMILHWTPILAISEHSPQTNSATTRTFGI